MPGVEVEELRGHLRLFLEKHASEVTLRQHLELDHGYDPLLWSRAGAELGLQGMAVPAEYGGGGFGLTELGVVFEELGRTLACGPFFSTLALAVPTIASACRPDVARPWLASIADGSTAATFAWSGVRPSLTSLAFADGAVSGAVPIVVDGNDADLVLVAARTASGSVGLYALRSPEVQPLTALDHTRRLGALDLDGAPADELAADAGAALDRVAQVAGLLLAAEQLGVATRAMEAAVAYAKTRVQFGRHIGSFQAIKHRCADLLVDVELSRSLVYHALDAVHRDPSVLELESSLVRGFVLDVAVRVAGANLQIHGGIGFTWEHTAHLYLKRAKSAQLLLGRPEAHRARAADLLGISGGAA